MEEMKGFAINQGKVVFEKFDDEFVLINLDNGNYFSIRNLASYVWEQLTAGAELNTVKEAIISKFKLPAEEVGTEIDQFVQSLLNENLMIRTESNAALSEVAVIADSLEYATPKLEVYSDMQDLILLDPIHEVDDSGWPNVKEEAKDSKVS